ncbi:hypothetical protein AGMMS50212_00510 [Spirochaetia bacterium]|nr:hypothetical protein AGMMS50212_00510 [Spirochaetia bacterium]
MLVKDFLRRPSYFRRSAIGVVVAAAHIALILLLAVNDSGVAAVPENENVFKLTDIREYTPPPEPEKLPPPPPIQPVVEKPLVVPEAPAENFIESDEPLEEVSSVETNTSSEADSNSRTADAEYLPQNKISQKPEFDRNDLIVDYPPIAQRSGIEGIVYLELFIDKEGYVRKVIVLKETPPGKGFGEAAVRAFQSKKCKPAKANGEAVAVRYRYPVRFILSN